MVAALLGMVTPKLVYEEALGLYDLELALQVAQVLVFSSVYVTCSLLFT